jgi:plasmid stability protein
MATLTIRNLNDSVKARLRLEAAKHQCSMEEEARRILRRALLPEDQPGGLGSRIHGHFADLGDVRLSLPHRGPPRPAPDFSDSGP